MKTTAPIHSAAAKAKRAASAALAKDPAALLEASAVPAVGDDREKIRSRLEQMPESMRRNYLDAMSENNRPAAVKAFCHLCVGWVRGEVGLCTDPACPLHPYRPERP
ncbi:MAG TPA: hypothetical protein VM238_21305 [Phycisphaerae bacterium]|nr:hypothetical protein [Phycisphaerae bacterium]